MLELLEPDQALLSRRKEIAAALAAIVPDGTISDEATLTAYDGDALTAYRQTPLVCVLPRSTDEVAAVLRYAARENIRIVPRGAGTSLSGGALPAADGILLGLARMNRILEVDYENRCVVVQPGVTNASVTRAVEKAGFYYAPDPSSQIACTIGGNVAENSGGIHCLKYGLTTQNLMGVELVMMNGERVRLGGKHAGDSGLLRILPRAPATRTLLIAFDSVRDAGETVAAIIAAGIIPAALEFMDRACIATVEAFCAPGYPANAEAILIVEVDGMAVEAAEEARHIADIAKTLRASRVHECTSAEERARVWSGRKAAFGAMGRLKPDLLCMDGTIPRRALADVLEAIAGLAEKYRLGCCNVFHAGDGNLHPLIVFDVMAPGELERAEEFGADILRLCVAKGGVLTGEHGVGVEKKALMGEMFSETDLRQQERLKCAFDGENLLNPGKVFPTLHACVERGHMRVHAGRMPFGNLPRM